MNKLIEHFKIELPEGITEGELEDLILEKITEKDTQISQLESERDSLSKDKEELTTTVEGLNSEKENLSKELTETKTKLATTEGKLEQVTGMYKEQFIKDSDTPEVEKVTDKVSNDVMEMLIDSK